MKSEPESESESDHTMMSSSSSDDDDNTEDVITELKQGQRAMSRQLPRKSYLPGSSCYISDSCSETRKSRFNDRPLWGSPMLSMSSEDETDSEDDCDVDCTRDDLNAAAATVVAARTATTTATTTLPPYIGIPTTTSSVSDPSPIGSVDCIQSAKHKIGITREILDKRFKRISSSFYAKNSGQKVPRFLTEELSLGDQLGQGEFGTVYEIDSLDRKDIPFWEFNDMLDDEMARESAILEMSISDKKSAESERGEPLHSSHTLPVAQDLFVGNHNLDNFLRRRLEAIEHQESHRKLPTIKDENKISNTNTGIRTPFLNSRNNNYEHNGYTNQQLANHSRTHSDEINSSSSSLPRPTKHRPALIRSPKKRRPHIRLKDEKGKMVDRQNDDNGFDGYAVKIVRNDIHNERKKFNAVADIATEAKILSALSHPNIIQIRGIVGYIENPGGMYGIIMDKLCGTLQEQIHQWAKVTVEDDVPTAAPGNHPILERAPQWILPKQEKDKQKQLFRQTKFFVERMVAVLDVAHAMKHLHEKRIMFRDLKPENVGHTKGNYVLFDFGLARELKERDRVGDASADQYRATGLTGSRLFMAPEVVKKKPYGFSADVYSFAMLFWEVISLKEVFPNLNMKKHYTLVIKGGRRPSSLQNKLPSELNEMMEASWDNDPSKRPTFESICNILAREIENYEKETRRSSSGSFSIAIEKMQESVQEKMKFGEAIEKMQYSVQEKMQLLSNQTSWPSLRRSSADSVHSS